MNKKELFKLIDESIKKGNTEVTIRYNSANHKYTADVNGERHEFIDKPRASSAKD